MSNPPNLEQYKKQAKDLRKAHENGDLLAAECIKEHLPRLADTSIEEILAGDFVLQEAQHVVACRHGYKNWDWLRAVATQGFDLIARLSDREVQLLLRVVAGDGLVRSLKGIIGSAVADKILSNKSERTRGETVAAVEALEDVDPVQVDRTRLAILKHVADLAKEGDIAWPEGDATPVQPKKKVAEIDPRLLHLLSRPLEEMDTDEVVELFAGMAVQTQRAGVVPLATLEKHIASPFLREALQLTVDATEPALVQDILMTRCKLAAMPARRTRGIMVVEGIMAMVSNDPPRMVHYKLSAIYQAERVDVWDGPNEVGADDLIARLRRTPFAQMDFAKVDEFLTDMADLWRRERIDGLRALLEAVGYPLLRRALELVCADIDHDELVQTLEMQQEEELGQVELRYKMVAVGIGSVWDLKTPEETVAAVRQVVG